jgi:hydroxymethylpyrimidine pyrophosphatase-like HAD family hydrolase
MELFVSDLDGTLLNSQKMLSEQTISLLNQLLHQGIQFTVATARSFESAQAILAPLHLSLPMVLFNGVFIYDPIQRRYLVSQFLSEPIVKEVLEFLARHHIHPLLYTQDTTGASHVYYTGIRNQSEDRYITDRLANGDTRFRLVSSFQQAITEHVITINAIHSKHVLDPLVDEVRRHTFPVNPHYAEDIYAPGYY